MPGLGTVGVIGITTGGIIVGTIGFRIVIVGCIGNIGALTLG